MSSAFYVTSSPFGNEENLIEDEHFHSKEDKQDFEFYSEEEKKSKLCPCVYYKVATESQLFLQAVCDKSHEACVLEGFITLV